MKHISKGRQPARLAKFKRDNADEPLNSTYDDLTKDDRQPLAEKMLKEQGRLCAYTMQRIGKLEDTFADCHIEHIRPRHSRPDLQLDYGNMVLCAPGRDQQDCGWGARFKDNTEVDESNFVSPLRADCETRLVYRANGEAHPANPSDEAASATINILNLNHRELLAARSRALSDSGLSGLANKPLGAKETRRLSKDICLPDVNGDFVPFCVAIRQVAVALAEKIERRAARLRKLP